MIVFSFLKLWPVFQPGCLELFEAGAGCSGAGPPAHVCGAAGAVGRASALGCSLGRENTLLHVLQSRLLWVTRGHWGWSRQVSQRTEMQCDVVLSICFVHVLLFVYA